MQPNMTHFVDLKIDAVSQLYITVYSFLKYGKKKTWTEDLIPKFTCPLLVYWGHNEEHGELDVLIV